MFLETRIKINFSDDDFLCKGLLESPRPHPNLVFETEVLLTWLFLETRIKIYLKTTGEREIGNDLMVKLDEGVFYGYPETNIDNLL